MSQYLIIDSREHAKERQRITKYFDDNGIQYEVSKLLFGDYAEYSRPQLVIDRKKDIAELAKNCTREHDRFRRELERVAKTGSKLIILVEQNRYKDRDEWVQVRQIVDLIRWSSPHTMVRGEKIYRVLASWTAKYPVEVRFCDKRATGKNIVNILYGGK